MSKQDEKFAEAWELLTDSERAELMRSDASELQEVDEWWDEVTRGHCVGSLTCFALTVASGFIGFVLGWWLS